MKTIVFFYNVIVKYVLFDFNGTILDDVDVAIRAENETIEHFGLERGPLSRQEYLHVFTFPVKDYYEKVGFDWNRYSYEEVGAYWFKWYCALKSKYRLYDGAVELLKDNIAKGYENILLTASSLVEVKKQLKELEADEYFAEVLGLDNIYAGSKVDIALEWIKDKNSKDCIMLGDTLHDLQVAQEMGIDCILIAGGHQAKDVLLSKSDRVVDDIREVKL